MKVYYKNFMCMKDFRMYYQNYEYWIYIFLKVDIKMIYN